MFRNYQFRKFDFISILIILILAYIGVTVIGSATRINTVEGTAYYANRQALFFALGFVMMITVSLIDYHFICKLAPLVYIVNIGLLVAVLLFGKNVYGATRWLEISGYTIQPSEFTKLFIIIVFAKYFDMCKEKINKPHMLLLSFIIIGIPFLLIAKEDLSTSAVVLAIFSILLFVSEINYKQIFILLLIAAIVGAGLFWYIQQPDQKLLKPYQINRLLAYEDSDEFFNSEINQTDNSIQAIGSGRLLGKGLYNGKINQYNYISETRTDFIFAVLGEEFGFIGCSIVLLLVLALILRIIFVGKDVKDTMGQVIIAGYVGMLMLHTFINVGVATGIVPNTGIPFPFVSYGISSLWTNMIIMGMVLNISMQRKIV